jgi:hypothetical protein
VPGGVATMPVATAMEQPDPGRGQLHDVDVVVDPGVVVDGEAHLLAVETLGPLHVGDGNDHQLELPVHAHPPRGPPLAVHAGDRIILRTGRKAVTWSPGPAERPG